MFKYSCTYQGNNYCDDIDCQLELDEFPDGVVNVSSPHHCLHNGTEVIVD